MTAPLTCEICKTTDSLVADADLDGQVFGILCRDCGAEQQRLRALVCWHCGGIERLVVTYDDDMPAGLLCCECVAAGLAMLHEESD